MSGTDALLARLPQWTLVGGKGGVGKTTCSAALALRSAESPGRTLLLSTDPAASLGDALGASLTAEPRPFPAIPSLDAWQLDAAAARRAFLDRWRDVLITIVDRGTYLDRDDIVGLVDAALPGADEAMALLALADIAERGTYDRVLVDTAPTGHTLRLLRLPDAFRALVDLLDHMQGKHRFMVSALTHRYRTDAADDFITALRGRLARLGELLTDARRTSMLLVTRPEPLVVAETLRYASALREMAIGVSAVVVNALSDDHPEATHEALAELERTMPGVPLFFVPHLGTVQTGLDGVRRWSRALSAPIPAGAPASTGAASPSVTAPVAGHRRRARPDSALPPADSVHLAPRSVTLVGGKGGVGKTSVSCALALVASRAGARVLLVSTDPAPSIADALAQPIDDEERLVAGGGGLVARQIDAGRAFARWRDDYQARVDEAFAALLGPDVDAAHDRAVARNLLALAPPGIDELYALAWLGDALNEARYDRIVIDPAPTGHLLRLLEMPALALEWSHRLLRMMLKYRELAGGGDTAAELLAFARRTRFVGDVLRDRDRAGLIAVALDEPLVRLETGRVVDGVRAVGVDVQAIVWNRVGAVPTPLSSDIIVPQFVAPEVSPPPVGVERLLAWRAQWRTLAVDGD